MADKIQDLGAILGYTTKPIDPAERPMMMCGHTANGTNEKGAPICCICVGITSDAERIGTKPNLDGRLAKCGCGKMMPSDIEARAFFEYCGEGSKAATEHCLHCGFYESAHPTRHGCKTFEQHGAWEFDRFYCGCRGWD